MDHLPSHSAYGDALEQDDDLAADSEPSDADEVGGPSFADWSPTVAALTDLVEVVSVLRTEMWSLAGQKPPKHVPPPRPVGAAQRVAGLRRQAEADDVASQLFGEGR